MKHIFHYLNTTAGKHLVLVAKHFDYKHYDTGWMCDSNLPAQDEIVVPDMDIVESEGTFIFDTEHEAMEKICLEYGKQSTVIRELLIACQTVLNCENDSITNRINLSNKIDEILRK